jgi:hypothetical protein
LVYGKEKRGGVYRYANRPPQKKAKRLEEKEAREGRKPDFWRGRKDYGDRTKI